MRLRGFVFLYLALAGCHDNMVQQPRDDPYESSPLFANNMAMRSPPSGTVTRDAAQREGATKPPPITQSLLARGKERYGIYCAVCHGYDGRGRGFVTTRGFPHPPSYLEPRLRAATAAHFYDVITNGYGIMYSYADRVEPADRWAIAAYIRVLQEAQRKVDRPDAS